MEKILSLTKEDIRRELAPEAVRVTAIIQSAILTGPLLFFAIVLFLHYAEFTRQEAGPGASDPQFAMLLLQIMGAFSLMAVVAASVVPGQFLKPARLKACAASQNPIAWMVNHHRVITIIRLALLEAAALFGLCILILAVMDKYLDQTPILWLATIPLLILVLFGLLTFPTRSTIVDFMDQHILQPLKRSIS